MKQRLVSIAAVAALFGLVLPPPAGAAGEGKPYGARDPVTCGSTAAPASGGPSAAQAARYVACGVEKVSSGNLYLVSDVKVQVGAPRPFLPRVDSGVDVDTSKQVYPIRGSFRRYICDPVSSYMGNAGKNCAYANETEAKGTCYRTSFGDWRCSMLDVMHAGLAAYHVPPPK